MNDTHRKMLGSLLSFGGAALYVAAAYIAAIYLFGAVLWMHAAALPALLFTLLLLSPVLLLAWFLSRKGRALRGVKPPGPWYRVREDGTLVRRRPGD